MRMKLSISANLISGSTRALNMMRECGVLTIPKPDAKYHLTREADCKVIAKAIHKIAKEAGAVERKLLANTLVDELSAAIRWGYRTVDASSVSYLMEKIDPNLREVCYAELARMLKAYGFTGYDRQRLSFLASYAGINKTKRVAICLMAAIRGGVLIDIGEKDSDMVFEAWDSIPVVPDYLFCFQKPITAAMSPNTRSMLNEIAALAIAGEL